MGKSWKRIKRLRERSADTASTPAEETTAPEAPAPAPDPAPEKKEKKPKRKKWLT